MKKHMRKKEELYLKIALIFALAILLVLMFMMFKIGRNDNRLNKTLSQTKNIENVNVAESKTFDDSENDENDDIKGEKNDSDEHTYQKTEDSKEKNSDIENEEENKENQEKPKTEENKNAKNTSDYQNKANYNNELFSEYYARAEEIMKGMTLDEKVGQMFLARYPGTSVALNETINFNPGGYILFAKDFSGKTKTSIASELSNLQSNSKINMFLAVDEEGGTVTRVSSYTNFRNTRFKSPQNLLNEGGIQAVLDDSEEKSNLLKSLGLNMNLAPVVDVPTNSTSFMYDRSFGTDATKTAGYIKQLITKMNQDNMISSMKHFPGYGDNVDTHTGIAIDKRAYISFENTDFLPFEAGIQANGPTIMVNHNIINCLDASKPASLSENVHKILRENLGFSGLIITDDLAMAAVKSYVANGEAAVQAVIAGNDLIISSNFKTQKQDVINAVKNGRIPEETINTAVRRILACKLKYGIIE